MRPGVGGIHATADGVGARRPMMCCSGVHVFMPLSFVQGGLRRGRDDASRRLGAVGDSLSLLLVLRRGGKGVGGVSCQLCSAAVSYEPSSLSLLVAKAPLLAHPRLRP